ncbi:MAG: Sjogren's syndrome/scleroderma autoantigen 1 family protein [Candidatus Helarchaeales archaeon]
MEEDEHIKKMAQMLRKGYTMVSDICPSCQSPLFMDKSNRLFCANCEKRVVKASGDEGVTALMQESVLLEIKKILNQKLQYVGVLINKTKDLDELNSLLRVLLGLLESAERINRIGSRNLENKE